MEKLPTKTPDFEETINDYGSNLEDLMSPISAECRRVNKIPKGEGKKARVLDAMLETFELIGGVPRMAIVADQFPMEFYKLFAKQIPGTMNQVNFNGPTQINIVPALPRSPLDGDDSEVIEHAQETGT